MPKKSSEAQDKLPFQYPKDTKANSAQLDSSKRKHQNFTRDIHRIDTIHNAVYGKPVTEKKPDQNKPAIANLFGEFLRRNQAKIARLRKEYDKTGTIPPQFNADQKTRELFLKLIGIR
jgi:hypothetical protein